MILGGGRFIQRTLLLPVGETGQPIKFGGVGRGICEDGIFGKEHFSKKTSFFRKRTQEIGAA
ncbi:MAG: hypothetical protein DWI02_02485 [Planctomycetota bacterium]|nr:MAG: hypothetical protein DWI02_02485 [Planctomycetota bacterium]